MAVFALWLAYAAAAGAVLWFARRHAASFSARTGLVLALLPLVFTGKAIVLGRLYGPADLYFTAAPWNRLPASHGVVAQNAILSDLAFANLPWRAAVREAAANGRAPLWNRFVLGGNPLLGAAQAGVFHPATWLGLWLPLPLSWTFSCAFTLLLALVAAFAFFRDFELPESAALVGAVGWGFSTYVVFWDGWSIGPSTATFPLLLLGLRRLARGALRNGIALTAAALVLSLFGGHPESAFHGAAAAGAYFLWELWGAGRRAAARAIGGAAGAGVLALLLSGPQLLPLLATLPHSAEYRARRDALAAGAASQSVPPGEAAARLLPDVLPFSHGIFGKSPVDTQKNDGSGMPLGYAGAVLFPLAALAFAGPARRRGRWVFLAFFLAGLAYGASAPGVLDVTSRLPGFALALNYRLVFLAGLGLAGLAALGTASVADRGGTRRLAVAGAATLVVLVAAFFAAQPVLAGRGLDAAFTRGAFLAEALPVALLAMAAAAARRRPAAVAGAALVSLVAQRFLEMQGTYPTLPPALLAPPLPTLAAVTPSGSEPSRVVAAGGDFRPNAGALYGVEDVRGYESVVLDRVADTFPLWSQPQAASFNRVDDLTRPFLPFLNVRDALAAPDAAPPAGWIEQARGPELAVFRNPRALPRAFVPRTIRAARDPIAALQTVSDFGAVVVLAGEDSPDAANGAATVRARERGPDLLVDVDAASPALVATSVPDWPGWSAETSRGPLALVTVNHAFVGFRVEPGRWTVRLRYRPRSWTLGLLSGAAGLIAAAGVERATRRLRAS